MKQYIYQAVAFLLFISIFGFLYGDTYWDFQGKNKQFEEYIEETHTHRDEFNQELLSEFGDEVTLYSTPNLALLDDLVEEISKAKEKLYLEAYIFTETRIRDAIIEAHMRGIEVKVLLENNPYKAPYLNDKHYKSLQDAGVDVRWSDPLNYSLNHSKFLIIDDRAYISTGNFSYSLFKHNRDFVVAFENVEFVQVLEKLFLQDFLHEKGGVIHPNIVLSPDYSREKLSKLIGNTQKSIDFYFPYIADSDFETILFDASKRGIKIRGIVEKNFYKENEDIIKRYTQKGISLTPLESEKLHVKSLLFDDSILYIGSINFSSYSFDENRELGVLLRDESIISQFKKIYDSDL